jgi:hypothetical protein
MFAVNCHDGAVCRIKKTIIGLTLFSCALFSVYAGELVVNTAMRAQQMF